MRFALLGHFNPKDMGRVHQREEEVFGKPPRGVNVISRYSTVGGKGGFVNIVETNNAEGLASILLKFLNLVEFEVMPIVDTVGGKVTRLVSEVAGEFLPMHGPVGAPVLPPVAAPEEEAIETVLAETRKFPPPASIAAKACVKSLEEYEETYRRSMEDMEGFWAEKAEQLAWFEKWDRVLDYDFEDPRIRWFEGGKLNVAYMRRILRKIAAGECSELGDTTTLADPGVVEVLLQGYQDIAT